MLLVVGSKNSGATLPCGKSLHAAKNNCEMESKRGFGAAVRPNMSSAHITATRSAVDRSSLEIALAVAVAAMRAPAVETSPRFDDATEVGD